MDTSTAFVAFALLLMGTAGIVFSVLNALALRTVWHELNSRLTELVDSVRAQATSSGHAAGVAEERDRQEGGT